VVFAISGYVLVDALWRNAIRRQWKRRKRQRRQ